ncbi:MAG: hypothetical protein ACI8ZM_002896 [Crocinitomix sp.]|jgi:hypothetical protein
MSFYKSFIRLITMAIVLLLIASCEKPIEAESLPQEPVMPALTHTGANTFGYYIDFASAEATAEQCGELFVTNDGESVWSIPAVSSNFDFRY